MGFDLNHREAVIHIEEKNGRNAIHVEPKSDVFVSADRWETRYPIDLIQHVLEIKGPGYLCDEIMRDEDPLYVELSFRWGISSYIRSEEFAGRRLLDFGSGCGASTMVLSRMFPETNIVGIEMVGDDVRLAQHRARFYGVDDRVNFLVSPSANSLPQGIGDFDYIVLSGVFEHLLPNERAVVLPLVWRHLKRNGVMFLDQMPYRWFPVETHTTNLPLVNYLPDRWALSYARLFSRRVETNTSWPELLRRGIRGGSTREVLRILNRKAGSAELLNPCHQVKDRIDLWYQLSSAIRKPVTKKLMRWVFKAIRTVAGVTVIPVLSLAIRRVG